ncbi:UNVERIFIED_CONTAM: hypothetical protein HDU68_011963, partial [Siphonaria sp. JEL0065]
MAACPSGSPSVPGGSGSSTQDQSPVTPIELRQQLQQGADNGKEDGEEEEGEINESKPAAAKKKRRTRNKGVKHKERILDQTTQQTASTSVTNFAKPTAPTSSFKKPHASYVCRVCSLKGIHFYEDCDNPHGCPPDTSYLCMICRVPGHHIRWCPQKKPPQNPQNQNRHIKPQQQQQPHAPPPLSQEQLQLQFQQWQEANVHHVSPIPQQQQPQISIQPNATASTLYMQSYYTQLFNAQNSNVSSSDSNMMANLNQSLYNPLQSHSTFYEAQPKQTEVSKSYSPSAPQQQLPYSNPSNQSPQQQLAPSQFQGPPSHPPRPPSVSTLQQHHQPPPSPQNSHPTSQQDHQRTTSPQPSPGPQQQPPPRKPFCKFYAKSKCNNGTACPFSHDKSSQPCAFLNLYGACSRGPSCAYSHEILPDGAKEEMRKEHETFKQRKAVERKTWELRIEMEKALVVDAGEVGHSVARELVKGIVKNSGLKSVDDVLAARSSSGGDGLVGGVIGKEELDAYFENEFGMDFSSGGDRLKRKRALEKEDQHGIRWEAWKKCKTTSSDVDSGDDVGGQVAVGNQKNVGVPDWIRQLQQTGSWGGGTVVSAVATPSVDSEFSGKFVAEKFQYKRDVVAQERQRIREAAASTVFGEETMAQPIDNGTGVAFNAFLTQTKPVVPDWIRQLHSVLGVSNTSSNGGGGSAAGDLSGSINVLG